MTVPVPVPTEPHPIPTRFFIPDTLANWPWPRAINPAYEQCKLDSAAWCEKYKAFSPKAQKAFNLCDFNLLASLAYAHLPSDVNRVGCDLMNLFFVIDEHSDAMDRNSVNVWVEIIMDALRNPTKPRPDDEPIVGEITRTFWENAMKSLGPTSQRRFIDTFETYLYAVVVQAEDRDHHVFRDVDSYMTVRRDTIGAKPSFALLEHDMELPDEVFNHPLLEDLRTWCIDMLILGNDLCSYNVEQSRGDDGHNIVKLVMLQERTDLHGAMKYISDMHDALAEHFLNNYRSMPSFGQPIDEWVARYIHGLGNWVRANDTWSFESWRYFKYDGLRIQKERWVELLPPANQEDLTSSIPPESRWIQPLVVPNRARPENVGIVAMEVYVPNRTSGNQDIINVTKDTLHSLISKYAIDPRSIGRFDVCFETSFSAAEIRSALLPIFTSVGNADVQGSPSNQLCSGLFDTVNWIESRSWDGRYGIVITGHGVESGSTGASAILVGPNASIVVEPTHGMHLSSDVKQTSEDFHLDAFIGSYQRYEKKIPKDQVIECAPAKVNGRINGHVNGVNGHTSKKNTCDFVIFGTPFGIVGNKSFLTNMLHTETFNNINWVDQLVPAATLLARKCGNAGMASIYIGLASLLSTEDVRSVKDKRVGIFDHRQSTSVFFTLKVVGDYSSIVDKISLQTRLRI